jgi:hypothetical protein
MIITCQQCSFVSGKKVAKAERNKEKGMEDRTKSHRKNEGVRKISK